MCFTFLFFFVVGYLELGELKLDLEYTRIKRNGLGEKKNCGG